MTRVMDGLTAAAGPLSGASVYMHISTHVHHSALPACACPYMHACANGRPRPSPMLSICLRSQPSCFRSQPSRWTLHTWPVALSPFTPSGVVQPACRHACAVTQSPSTLQHGPLQPGPLQPGPLQPSSLGSFAGKSGQLAQCSVKCDAAVKCEACLENGLLHSVCIQSRPNRIPWE